MQRRAGGRFRGENGRTRGRFSIFSEARPLHCNSTKIGHQPDRPLHSKIAFIVV